MKCVVLGGTGHIGSAIVRELRDFDYEVTVLTRDKTQLWDDDVVALETKNYEQVDYSRLFQSCHYVVDAGAPYPIDAIVPPALARSLERAMQKKVSAARANGSAYVYVSSFVTLLANQRAHPYYLLKKRLEQIVVAECRRGLQARFLNPPACFGPYDPKRVELALVAALADGRVPALMDAEFEYLDVRDLARAIREGIEKGEWHGPVRLPALSLSTRDLAREIAVQSGVDQPSFVRMPTSLATMSANVAEMGTYFLGLKTMLPALSVNLLVDGAAFYNEAPITKVDSRYTLQNTVADAIAWYRAQGCLAA